MTTVFLSHSSKDKVNYVELVANELRQYNIIYDKFTFEAGERPLDEIIKGLGKTDLFVLFLSDNALNSTWVHREISEAKSLLDSNERFKIFPVIIDEKITHEDRRIPDWLRDNYNLRIVKRYKVLTRRIMHKVRELSWSRHPEAKKVHEIFIGRNDFMDSFEARIHDYDKIKPSTIIVSGFSGVGRRTFIHRALFKTNLSELSHKPSPIVLDRNVSIEDFILKINDLGLADLDEKTINLTSKSVDEKIQIIHVIMHAAIQNNEFIYIVDEGCIVNYERQISDWFKIAIETFQGHNRPIFCIASRYRVNIANRPRSDLYYFTELNELNSNERKRLLSQLLEIYKLKPSAEDFNDISDLLFGYPDQALFAVDLLKSNVGGKVSEILPIITEYSTNKAAVLLKKHEQNEVMMDFIRLLAQFEVITSSFIFSIVDESTHYSLLEELTTEHIIELAGIDGEVIRLNDIVRDYIKRNRLALKPEYKTKILNLTKKAIASDDIFEHDSSEFIFTIKEALKNGIPVDEKYLIPSHYLRCMRDMYYNKESLDKIIELADKVLQNSKNMVGGVVQDIKYYLCLALAKKKDGRTTKEVQDIKGDEHTFILGFYYRHCGRLQDALNNLLKIKDGKFVGSRARRELVQVYVQLEEYSLALDFAKSNFEENRGNQFHTQAYFNCLINSEYPEKHSTTLRALIENLRTIDSEQSTEMADIADSMYVAWIDKSKTRALDLICDACDRRPENHYSLLAMADIAIKYRDKETLALAIGKLRKLEHKGVVSIRTVNKYAAYYHALNGQIDIAIASFERDLDRYPAESRIRFTNRLKEYAGMQN